MTQNGFQGGGAEGGDDDGIRREIVAVLGRAGLAASDDDIARLVRVVRENRAGAARLRDYLSGWDEPAFGLPARRRP